VCISLIYYTLLLLLHYYVLTLTIFIVISIVMLDSTGKNTTDVFKLTCHCFILVVYLVQRPDDRLVNKSETCSLYLRKNIYVESD